MWENMCKFEWTNPLTLSRQSRRKHITPDKLLFIFQIFCVLVLKSESEFCSLLRCYFYITLSHYTVTYNRPVFVLVMTSPSPPRPPAVLGSAWLFSTAAVKGLICIPAHATASRPAENVSIKTIKRRSSKTAGQFRIRARARARAFLILHDSQVKGWLCRTFICSCFSARVTNPTWTNVRHLNTNCESSLSTNLCAWVTWHLFIHF